MTTLVLFLAVWVWISSAVGSFGLTVGYFDGASKEAGVSFDCLETGSLILVFSCLFGGPVILLMVLKQSQFGRYGLVWRWKNA